MVGALGAERGGSLMMGDGAESNSGSAGSIPVPVAGCDACDHNTRSIGPTRGSFPAYAYQSMVRGQSRRTEWTAAADIADGSLATRVVVNATRDRPQCRMPVVGDGAMKVITR